MTSIASQSNEHNCGRLLIEEKEFSHADFATNEKSWGKINEP